MAGDKTNYGEFCNLELILIMMSDTCVLIHCVYNCYKYKEKLVILQSIGIIIIQVFAIELVTFAVDFVPLAVEFGVFAVVFVPLAVEFGAFTVEFVPLALQFVALAMELDTFVIELGRRVCFRIRRVCTNFCHFRGLKK